jgi:hypothetical protein
MDDGRCDMVFEKLIEVASQIKIKLRNDVSSIPRRE